MFLRKNSKGSRVRNSYLKKKKKCKTLSSICFPFVLLKRSLIPVEWLTDELKKVFFFFDLYLYNSLALRRRGRFSRGRDGGGGGDGGGVGGSGKSIRDDKRSWHAGVRLILFRRGKAYGYSRCTRRVGGEKKRIIRVRREWVDFLFCTRVWKKKKEKNEHRFTNTFRLYSVSGRTHRLDSVHFRIASLIYVSVLRSGLDWKLELIYVREHGARKWKIYAHAYVRHANLLRAFTWPSVLQWFPDICLGRFVLLCKYKRAMTGIYVQLTIIYY